MLVLKVKIPLILPLANVDTGTSQYHQLDNGHRPHRNCLGKKVSTKASLATSLTIMDFHILGK